VKYGSECHGANAYAWDVDQMEAAFKFKHEQGVYMLT
jgi:hypothetical protein